MDGLRIAEEAGAPVAVPTVLPGGYEFLGGVGVNRRDGDNVASAWLYATDGTEDAGPPVHVCVTPRGVNADVYPVEIRRERVQDGTERYTVVVTSADRNEASLSVWAGVDFTEDWQRAEWIDER